MKTLDHTPRKSRRGATMEPEREGRPADGFASVPPGHHEGETQGQPRGPPRVFGSAVRI
jgi:hypothetical protein